MINLTKSYLSQVEAPTTVRSAADEERERRRAQRVYNKHKPVERELHRDRDEARAQGLARALRTSLLKTPDDLQDDGWRTDTSESPAAAEQLKLAAAHANGQAEKLGLDRQRADRLGGAATRSDEPERDLADTAQNRLLRGNPKTIDLPHAAMNLQSHLKEIFLAGERLLSSGNASSIDEVLGKLQALQQTDAEKWLGHIESESAATQRARLEGSFAFLEEFYGGLATGDEDQVRLQSALALARSHVLGGACEAGVDLELNENAPQMPGATEKAEDRQRELSMATRELNAADLTALADKERKRAEKLEQAQSDLSGYLHALVELANTFPTPAGTGGGGPTPFERLEQIRTYRPETSLARLRNARDGATDGLSRNIASCLQKIEQACEALPTSHAGKERLAKAITEEKRRLFKDEKELAEAAALAQLPAIRSREREIEARKGDTLASVTVRAI